MDDKRARMKMRGDEGGEVQAEFLPPLRGKERMGVI